jgi:uncharacterized membrane protein YbhN (UPF0104 family)
MKQKILYLIKLLVGLLLVIWILGQIDQKQFIEYFRHIGIKEFFYVSVLGLASLVLQYERWKYLVKSNSTTYERQDLFSSFLAGFTLRLTIPGGHAEWSKAFLMSGRKRGKIIAVGMEKILPAIFKIILLGLVIPFSFPRYKIAGMAIALITILVYFLMPRLKVMQNLLEKQISLHRLFIVTSLQSSGIFLLSAAQYHVLLNQDYSISFLDSMHATVYLWAAGVFPFSLSGLGIREGLAVYFFRLAGVSSADAVATSLFLFTLNNVIPALFGIYYLYRNRQNLKNLGQTFKSSKDLLISLLKSNKDPS